MIICYITYLIFIQGLYAILGNIFLFPIAYTFRHKIRLKNSPKLLWWLLHDTKDMNDWGDVYFNPKQKRNFWIAWRWVFRNPIHNWQQSHKIEGKQENHKGQATIQSTRKDSGLMWRTLKTTDKDGTFKDKYGKWIDIDKSILGKQSITFEINGKKYFRYSGAKPVNLFGNLWWILEYKFGFEHVGWAIQFHPFEFKRYNGTIKYNKIEL